MIEDGRACQAGLDQFHASHVTSQALATESEGE